MVVRKTKRVTEMAAGAVRCGAQRRPAGGAFGRGWCGVAGAVLGALAMAATAGPAAGQGTPYAYESYTLPERPVDHRPLAVAYLAVPYSDKESLKGPATIAPQGGSSLYARFLRPTGSGWEGIPIAFFDRIYLNQQTRLAKDGDRLIVGGKTPLQLKLYFFMEEPLVSTLKIRAYASDNWAQNRSSGIFSLLSDTTFVIEGPRLGIFEEKEIACVNKRTVDPKYGPSCEVSKDEVAGEVEVTGAVIEDPLSGDPALFMKARKALGGPPSWLKKVPTEICVVRQKGLLVTVPESIQRIDLVLPQDNDRWCSPTLTLNYLAMREEGIQVASLPRKTQLDSRSAPGDKWRMWAETPKEIQGKWVQRIVLHPPQAVEPSEDPPKLSLPPAPVTPASSFEIRLTGQLPEGNIGKFWYRSPPFGTDGRVNCEIPSLLSTGKWGGDGLTLADATKLGPHGRLIVTEPYRRANLKQQLAFIAQVGSRAYCGVASPVEGQEGKFTATLLPPPPPDKTAPSKEKVAPTAPPLASVAKKPGPPVKVVFGSSNPELTDKLSHAGKAANEQGVFEAVDSHQLRFTLPPGSGHRISRCDIYQQPALRCEPDADGQSLEIEPKQRGVAIPRLIRVTVAFGPLNVNLVFQPDGPGDVRIQKLSAGKSTDLLKLEGSRSTSPTSREISVSWKSGDKIKVSLEDADAYKVTAATLDKRPIALNSDGEFEIPIKADLDGLGVSITTKDRIFSGTLTVTAHGGDISVWHENEKLGSVGAGTRKDVEVKGAKYNDKLSVQVADPEFEVAKVSLSVGQNVTVLDGAALQKQRPTFSLDRKHLHSSDKGDKLAALHLEAELKAIDVPLPTEVLLKPAVRLGKRLLPLQSCKVTLAKAEATFTHKRDGTLATFGKDKRVPKRGSYAVEVAQGPNASAVCRGLEPEGRVAASKLNELGPDRTLPIPLKRSGSRAFVGVVSLSPDISEKQANWRAAVEALGEAFKVGANEGKYLWGAIFGPDGNALVKSETADDISLESEIENRVIKSRATMDRLTEGGGVVPFDSLVVRIASEVADFDGNVDVLIVGPAGGRPCGWSNPFKGSRAALVRLSVVAGQRGKELISGVRACDRSEKAGAVPEVEVVPREWTAGVEPDMQLKRAITEAAKSFPKQ